jgi:hypothetical protein
MSRPMAWLLASLLIAPAIAYFVYRLAKGLGFLDPPLDREHELRRTIVVSLYAFLLMLPVGIYGFDKGWPRVWVLFGILVTLALLFFVAGGVWSARELWKLRHPQPSEPRIANPVEGEEPPAELEIGGEEERQEALSPKS